MSRKMMVLLLSILVLMVAIYMMPTASNFSVKNAGSAGVSFVFPDGMDATMRPKWENDADANYIAKRGGGKGTYALKMTPCSDKLWGKNRDDACATLGFGWFGVTQRACSRSGFGGTAQYLCAMRAVERKDLDDKYSALKSKYDNDEDKIAYLTAQNKRQADMIADARKHFKAIAAALPR
jgi:hypothetical protein